MTIQLDAWQKEILEYDGNILLGKGRRIGATHIFAIKAVEWLIKHHNPHPKSQIVCSSIYEDQAELIIGFATAYAQQKYPRFVAKKTDRPTKKKLILKVNGNKRILLAKAVGATGDATRGFEGQILMVDEAAFQPENLYLAAKPILATTGGKIWMWSTFNGRKGYFWDKYEEAVIKKVENPRFKVWEENTEEVFENREISLLWSKEKREGAIKFLKDEKRDMSSQAYAQEYLGIAQIDDNRFFTDDEIKKVCTRDPTAIIPNIGSNYMGNDLARMGGDAFTAEVLKDTGSKIIQIDHYTRTLLKTTDNEDLVEEFTKKWNCEKAGIDAGSGTLGVSILDHLIKIPYMKKRIVAMNNRAVVTDKTGRTEKSQRIFKEDLYDNLRSMMQKDEIELFKKEEIRASLRSINIDWKEDAHGMSKAFIYGRFSHIVEGIVRAAWLAKKEKSKKINILSF